MGPTPERIAAWFRREPPAAPRDVAMLAASAPMVLPVAYLALFRLTNGGEGPLDVRPRWFHLWPAEVVLERNGAYEVREWLPFLFGFGTNGGRELLAFETRVGPPWPVVFVPLDDLDMTSIVPLAASFQDFLELACTAQRGEFVPGAGVPPISPGWW